MLKTLLLLSFFTMPTLAHSNEGIVCVDEKCRPVEINEKRGGGLLGLTNEQKSKKNGIQKKDLDKNYLFNKDNEQVETSMGLKLFEIKKGMCLIDPNSPDKFYKVTKVAGENVEYVVENENHGYMLAWNYVTWNHPNSAEIKTLRSWPCKRTPNLWDEEYVTKCVGKGAASGKLYCEPKKKF